ncbi:MAG: hypothetical protein HS115_03460 [Spirochaetales bacterium]|nr:hypothetical protein [Spirochaetales bacterium]
MIRSTLAFLPWLFFFPAIMAFQLAHLSLFLDHDVVAYYEHTRRHFFFNPHHLLFTIYGRALTLALADWPHSTMFLFQLVHLSVATLTILYFCYTLQQQSHSFFLALSVGGLLFSLRGFWVYSHIYDTPILPTCLGLITFINIARGTATVRQTMGSALLMALTLAFHQKHFLLLFPAALLTVYKSRDSGLPRFFPAALFLSLSLLLIGLCYFFAGAIHHGYPLSGRTYLPGVEKGGDFFDWIFLYSHYGNSWGKDFDPVAGWQGFFQAIVYTRKKTFGADDPESLLLGFFFSVALFALLIAFWRRNAVALLAFLWFLLEAALSFWWEPIYFEHWVSPTAILCLATGLGFCQNRRNFNPGGRLRPESLLAVPVLCLAILLGGWNYEHAVRPAASAVHFGHWEDFYLKSRYVGLWNSLYSEAVPARMESAEQARSKRLAILQNLRSSILSGQESPAKGAWRFEKALRALEDVAPDDPALPALRQELDVLRTGRENYATFHGHRED